MNKHRTHQRSVLPITLAALAGLILAACGGGAPAETPGASEADFIIIGETPGAATFGELAAPVVLGELPTTFDAMFDASNSGQVWPDGRVVSQIIAAGDDMSNFPVKGFISFDISGLPVGPDYIAEAKLNVGCAATRGSPFTDLGLLKVYEGVGYGTLSAAAFNSSAGHNANSYSRCPASIDVTNSLRQQLRSGGSTRQFQVGLAFGTGYDNDGDSSPDDYEFASPTLKIQYFTPKAPEIVNLIGPYPASARPGEEVRISWQTRNAAHVFLYGVGFNNGIEVAASGDYTDRITTQPGYLAVTYTLRAVGAIGAPVSEVTQDLVVQVAQPVTGNLRLNRNNSGTIYYGPSADRVEADTYSVGDDSDNNNHYLLLTFDYDGQAPGSIIKEAYLELGPCDVVGRNPFTDLGRFAIVNEPTYWILDASEWVMRTGPFFNREIIDSCYPESIDVTQPLQDTLNLGLRRSEPLPFQLKIYFDRSPDGDGVTERLRFINSNLAVRVNYVP